MGTVEVGLGSMTRAKGQPLHHSQHMFTAVWEISATLVAQHCGINKRTKTHWAASFLCLLCAADDAGAALVPVDGSSASKGQSLFSIVQTELI